MNDQPSDAITKASGHLMVTGQRGTWLDRGPLMVTDMCTIWQIGGWSCDQSEAHNIIHMSTLIDSQHIIATPSTMHGSLQWHFNWITKDVGINIAMCFFVDSLFMGQIVTEKLSKVRKPWSLNIHSFETLGTTNGNRYDGNSLFLPLTRKLHAS